MSQPTESPEYREVSEFLEGGALLPNEDHCAIVYSHPDLIKKLLEALVKERQWNAGYAKELQLLRARQNAVSKVLQFEHPAIASGDIPAVFDLSPDHK